MGRSNADRQENKAGGGSGAGVGKSNGSPMTKIVGAVAAVAVAVVCSVFGIQTTSGNSDSNSNNAQVTASQTTLSGGSASSSASSDSSSSGSKTTLLDSGKSDSGSSSGSEARSNLTFRNEERLQEHYEKHGIDMGFSSAEVYLAGANKVLSNPDCLHKTESKDGDDAYYLEDTGEFVVVSKKGYIRTYFLASKDYFERQ